MANDCKQGIKQFESEEPDLAITGHSVRQQLGAGGAAEAIVES